MEVGIGLPNAVPETSGAQLVEWARRSDSRGFSTLGTIDRILYENYEPMTALAAAAAATERIGLATTVLLGPLHPNAMQLAKQALSLQALSGGRFTLGIGLGARDDDYAASEIETGGRGRRLDEMLEKIEEAWAGDELGPSVDAPPRLVVGGHARASFARAARFGDGWIAGGSGPEQFAEGAEKAGEAWSDAGRDGGPHLMALAYFALGDGAEGAASSYLGDYYAWLGAEVARMITVGAATDADAVQRALAAYRDAGCDELVFCPCTADAGQVDLLADAAGV